MRWIRKLVIGLLPCLLGIARAQEWTPPSGEGRASSVAAQQVDASTFQGLGPRVDTQLGDVRSVVVVQGGRLIFEYHREGVARDSLQSVESATKSVLSLLVGIAVAQGRLRDLDRPLVELMPELAAVNPDPLARSVTVRHLLTMTAGFQGSERGFFDPKALGAFAMSRKFAARPGEVFRYDNPGSNLLAAVLGRVVGEEPAAFARRELFEPLGIDRVEWEADFQGHSLGFRGLKLRARDLARLGQLLLRDGEWDGRQIVPADYVAAATARQNPTGSPAGLAYGYMWWIPPSRTPGAEFLASGFGGQILRVDRVLDLVVAITSEVSEASTARNQAYDLAGREIRDMVRKRLFGKVVSP